MTRDEVIARQALILGNVVEGDATNLDFLYLDYVAGIMRMGWCDPWTPWRWLVTVVHTPIRWSLVSPLVEALEARVETGEVVPVRASDGGVAYRWRD